MPANAKTESAATHASIAEALVAAQSEMPAVKADATADTGKFKYSYVTLDNLIAKTRPVLSKHGLAIVQHAGVLDTGQPVLRTTILHSSGERFDAGELPLFSAKEMQPFGGSVTYARRYAWAAALGICADEDRDAQSAAPQNGQTDARPKAAPAAETPAEPTAEEVALVALVKERGGDPEAVTAAMATARKRSDYAAWFKFQREHWEAIPAPKTSEFQAPAGVK